MSRAATRQGDMSQKSIFCDIMIISLWQSRITHYATRVAGLKAMLHKAFSRSHPSFQGDAEKRIVAGNLLIRWMKSWLPPSPNRSAHADHGSGRSTHAAAGQRAGSVSHRGSRQSGTGHYGVCAQPNRAQHPGARAAGNTCRGPRYARRAAGNRKRRDRGSRVGSVARGARDVARDRSLAVRDSLIVTNAREQARKELAALKTNK
jgi:hypothetical protein